MTWLPVSYVGLDMSLYKQDDAKFVAHMAVRISDIFQHKKINFVSSSGHVIFYVPYNK